MWQNHFQAITFLQFAVDRVRNLRASEKGKNSVASEDNSNGRSIQPKSGCSIM
jgi:hypothetical protein